MKETRNLIEIITDMGDAQELDLEIYLRDYEKYKSKKKGTIMPDNFLYLNTVLSSSFRDKQLYDLTLYDILNSQQYVYIGRNVVSCQLYIGETGIYIPYNPNIYELTEMEWESFSKYEVWAQKSEYDNFWL